MVIGLHLPRATKGKRRRWGSQEAVHLTWAGVAAWLVCSSAFANTTKTTKPRVSFDVPSRSLASSLTDFAIQAKVSVGFGDIASCAKPSHKLVGRFTPEQGLARLLAGTGCDFRRLDSSAFAVQPAARPTQTVRRQAGFPAALPNSDLSEVVVVATRQSKQIAALAYSVSSVSGNVIRDEGVRDLGDLAVLVPGLSTTNLGMGRDKIIVRGVSDGPLTGLTQSLVGLYLDDAQLTFNAPDPDLRLVDVHQVEVLRGPQGTLYGEGAMGGVVHIVSEEPDPSHASGWLAVTGSATVGDTGAPSNAEDAAFNLPLLSGRGAARLVLYHEVDGGYIDDAKPIYVKDANQSRRNGGRLSVLFDLNDRWRISGGAIVQDAATSDTQYVSGAGARTDSRSVRVREPSDNDFRNVRVSLDGDLGWAQAHTVIAYIQHDIFGRYDASLAFPLKTGGQPTAYDQNEHIDGLSTESTLASSPNGRVQWLAGFNFAHTWETTRLDLTALGPPVTTQYQETRIDGLNDAAVFGQVSIPLFATVNLTLGARAFFLNDQVNSVDTYLTGQTYSGSVGETGMAPKVVVSARLAPSVLIYVQGDEGYRGPGINTAIAPGEKLYSTGSPQPQRLYKGDELFSYEAGVKMAAMDGHLKLDIAGFLVHWTGVQSDQLLSFGLPFTANVGDGENHGVEIDGQFRSGGFVLNAQAVFNDAKLYRANTAFSNLADTGLADVPAQSVGASARYSWNLTDRWSLQFDTHWTYVGLSQLLLNFNPEPHMGDYITGRVAVSLVDARWRFTLAIDNPADVHGDTFAYGNPFSLRFGPQATPLRPRTLSAAVQASF
jgi:outer membrane receptor protein involved in Fe transport